MAFDITKFVNSESMGISRKKTVSDTVMLPVSRLVPSKGNFYSKDAERVRKLAATIELLATEEQSGVQENLVVKPIDGTDQYEILAGETRWSAVNLLLSENRIKSDLVPCRVEESGDAVSEELILIFTNSTQRVRSDAEMMHEVERLRELLKDYKKKHKLGGTMQQAMADILSVSKTKVGTLENISRNLIPALMEMFEEDKMKTSVANRLAGMSKEEQELFWDYFCGLDQTANSGIYGFTIDHFKDFYGRAKKENDPDGDVVPDEGRAVAFSMNFPEIEEKTEPGEEISFKIPVPADPVEKDAGEVYDQKMPGNTERQLTENIELDQEEELRIVRQEYDYYERLFKGDLKHNSKKEVVSDNAKRRLQKYKVYLHAFKKYEEYLCGKF